jgi:ubiquinone/menaquinone biosynthesis C-methylase UbiE
MNQNEKNFWSVSSLSKKIGLWSTDQIKNFFIPFLDLKPNELIYDVGSGFSPLGFSLIPYILPNGSIRGFDKSYEIVTEAKKYATSNSYEKFISFQQADVYNLDNMNLPLADLTMCQQLLVNLPDPVTALEKMLNVTVSTGRIFSIENINYGSYVYRPDFSTKTNLRLSQTWQKLCIGGKFGYDYGDTTFGANLPQVFHELGLHDISWQILNTGANIKPPYSHDFKKSFTNNYREEKERLKDLILNHWAPKTDLSEKKIQFFIKQLIDSDYDLYALEHNLFLTQWYYPLISIVGWLREKRTEKKISIQKVDLIIE